MISGSLVQFIQRRSLSMRRKGNQDFIFFTLRNATVLSWELSLVTYLYRYFSFLSSPSKGIYQLKEKVSWIHYRFIDIKGLNSLQFRNVMILISFQYTSTDWPIKLVSYFFNVVGVSQAQTYSLICRLLFKITGTYFNPHSITTFHN